MLYNIIIVVITITCALLTLVVLLQSGQGQGLSGIGGGGGLDAGAGGLGARRTADLLSKGTSVLGGIFLILCIVANFAIDRQQQSNSILQQGAPLNDIGVPSQTQDPIPNQSLPPLTEDGNSSENN